jgi:hypothetical protein
MIKLDSCTIQTSSDAIKYIDLNQFTHSNKFGCKGGGIISDCYELKAPIPGLNHIKFDNLNQSLQLTFSAKVLNDSYLEGINKNTIENVIDNINQLSIIDVDLNTVLDNGVFHKIDSTSNVQMNEYDMQSQWNEICSHLAIAKNNERFSIKTWNTPRNNGIEYKGDQTTKKNRLTMYGKWIELQQPKNQEFLKGCKNAMSLLNHAKNILRVESNTTDFKAIRERCNSITNKVHDVLNAPGMPNIYMLDKITQPEKVNQMQIMFNMYEPGLFTFKQVQSYEGSKHIIKAFNYDEQQLKQYVYAYDNYETAKKNWNGRPGYPGIKQMIRQLKQLETTNNPTTNLILDYIRQSIINDYAIAI